MKPSLDKRTVTSPWLSVPSVLAFSGDVDMNSELLGGAVRDFNVMVKRGVWQARVKVWTEAASVQAQAGLVLQTQGQARCSFADGDATFKTGQGGWWQEGGQTLHWQPLSADAKVIVVALCALDAQS